MSYVFQLLITAPGALPVHVSPGFLVVRLAEWKQGSQCSLQECGGVGVVTYQILQTS